jgi:hypothetical protein
MSHSVRRRKGKIALYYVDSGVKIDAGEIRKESVELRKK